ncbi:MFS transporter [uncultured Maricaulis sp.]|uniref:MFS transporter n=1 Tax=uncultured Maricaulis sp. TaxID=174710 RepID=UPI0030DCCC53|tara:strand:+ start:1234 stop:2412 length:1179 start_codon:yes stop_codon:yes gene_type:complete
MFTRLTAPQYGNTRALIAAICCAAVCGIVFGLSMPLISLRLESMTGSALVIGLNGAALGVSTLVMAPLVPRLMAMVPARTLLIGSLSLAAVTFLLFPALPSVAPWFVLRFVVGCFITVVFVVSETWINQIVTPERRAFMLGVYGTALAGGFGIGGLIFAGFGPAGDLPFFLASAVFLIGIAPVALLQSPQAVAPAREDSSMSAILNAAGSAPAAILAGLAFGAIETLIFSMLPVYAERITIDPVSIGMMVFAVAMGVLSFQIPLGWIADRTDRRGTLIAIAAVATLGPVLVWMAGTHLGLLLPILFIQSGIASGLYTVGLSLLGERFTGGRIAAANAAFIFAYGLGSLLSPPAAGVAMDGVGPAGLLVVLAATAGAYLLFLAATHLKAARSS